MIPPLDNRGLLPAGIHQATWGELSEYFPGDARRNLLLGSAKVFAQSVLITHFFGCPLFLGGSTFSDKPVPGDIESTIVVRLAGMNAMMAREAFLLQAKHDEIKARHEVDFYVSLDVPGANDLSQYFQYVGEKTAAIKHLDPKDKRGIIEVVQWTHG